MKEIIRTLIVICVFVSACQSGGLSEKDNNILKQAAAIHEDAVKIGSALVPQIEDLINHRNSINVQARELTEAELEFTAKVDQIEASYKWYEENHVEVPGYGHEGHDHHGHDHHGHDHGHDHSHSHDTPLELLPEDMLRIQQEFRDTIMSIKKRVGDLQFSNVAN